MVVARRTKEAKEENPRAKQSRFGLRRGDQFEEALREGANQDSADEHWLSGLHTELEDEATSAADATAQKQSSGWGVPPQGESRGQPGSPVGSASHGDDLAMLAVELRRIKDRLRAAEEAMAEARSVCAASSAVVERIRSRPDQQRGPAPPEGRGQPA